ncbi:hypothetical protein GF356_05795, partial [candidate division GN15 bacterium]|nr:hypothetical protein [candidate division GN15 bacterium]
MIGKWFLVLICMFGLVNSFGHAAEEQEAGAPNGVMLLDHCLESQSRFDRVSLRGTTARGAESPTQGRVDFSFRRDGNQLDISGTVTLLKTDEVLSEFRNVATNDLAVKYYHKPEAKYPRTGIATEEDAVRDRAGWLENPAYSGALDGYLPFTGGKYSAQLLLAADDTSIEGQETIDGEPCTIVSGTTKYGKISLWISGDREGTVLR